ncbi:EF-hand calcium-binding domain-containing protein 12 isoform X2 [Astyanax mexicanus]|uniref:EF-hand calcium-binding domain-containing protein 12 isoform X2 n=1 Tax=Astyanax mexicanus TaxID=7994 RepID=UPI0020CACCAD|nr:EF-hand calcium-binding domain-containing protein 12 isoform X2 [Astyanax mexicanus]
MPVEVVHRARGKAPPGPGERCESGRGLELQSYTGPGGAELGDWIKQRRALRWSLDHLGDLDGWLHRKPTLTDLEYLVLDRQKTSRVTQAPAQLLPDRTRRGMQSEEASQQTDNMISETHLHPSTLTGPTGRAVENFRKQSLGEYLQSLEQCQQHNLPISQPTLKRGYLHPGDINMYSMLKQMGSSSLLGCRGHARGCHNAQQDGKKEGIDEKKSTSPKVHKMMSRRQPLSRWADPNAFWPSHDSHVRLCLPVKSNRPENVLFQLIEHTPPSCPGHWPVNQAGYFTSGDITKNKSYIL